MASVKGTRASKYARRGMADDEPEEILETAGNLLIKQLVQKQTNTKITLREQLLEDKQFTKGVGIVFPTEVSVGTTTLKDFKQRWQHAEKVAEAVGKKSSEGESSAIGTSKYINGVGRQQWELALAEKPGSVETRLYQFALKNKLGKPPEDTRPPDHPIHHLAAAARRLDETADPIALAKTLRRKRRQFVEAQADPPTVHYKAPEPGQSLWDAIEEPRENLKQNPSTHYVTCNKQTLYTIRDGEIVQITEDSTASSSNTTAAIRCKMSGETFVTVQDIVESPKITNRLSEEEIKNLPRFQNYERGCVSKTLFIKNLPRNVTETDLSDIFGQFQEPLGSRVVYRLMTGKMKGQAFVSFSSTDKAAAALEAINGTLLKDKPMIIQFGKQQD